MPPTFSYMGTIEVVTCGGCGIAYGLTPEFIAQRRKDHKGFNCPNGCNRAYLAENEEEKLRAENQRLIQNRAYLEDCVREERERKEEAIRSASAHKGRVTRIKNRVANGVCPCCNRSFTNLHQHMQNQHPDFKKQESA